MGRIHTLPSSPVQKRFPVGILTEIMNTGQVYGFRHAYSRVRYPGGDSEVLPGKEVGAYNAASA